MIKKCINCDEYFHSENKFKTCNKCILKKRKQTNLEKYGVENVFNSDDIKNKIKQTLIKNYGVDHPHKSKKVREKFKQTNLEKYGVDHPNKSEEVKEKIRNTVQERYGVDCISKSEEVKEKIRNTVQERYGVDCIFKSEEVKEKIRNTNLEKYKVINVYNSEKVLENKRKKSFNKLFTSDRLKNKVVPLFKLEDYKGTKNIYKFKCKKCNNVFEDNLHAGKIPRCFKCYPINKFSSKQQTEVFDYIKEIYNSEVLFNHRKSIWPFELDIHVPEKNIAIEYNGLYWHSELAGKDRNYHLNKTKLCEEQDIHLIHIFESEWLNKKDIVKSKLRQILGINDQKSIYARNCVIKEIETSQKNEFLEKYHIQGKDLSKVKLGVFYQEELVAVMTFGKRRLSLGVKKSEEGEYELLRFATSERVVGIASKLLKYFERNYEPKKIVTYADRRWTFHKNNLYEKIGFEKVSDGGPNYWYHQNDYLRHRFGYRKNVLNERLEEFDESLTEWQNMQLSGWNRIWDCGNLKYERK